jgi:hypothetical protein
MQPVGGGGIFGRRQRLFLAVNPAMSVAAFDRVGGFRPFALNPFQIGQPGAIDEFIDHARRQQRHAIGRRGRREWQFRLPVIRPCIEFERGRDVGFGENIGMTVDRASKP